jgi:hypothetical protein
VDGIPHEYEVKKKKPKKASDADATSNAAGTWNMTIDAPGQDGDVELTISGEPGSFSGSHGRGWGIHQPESVIDLDGNTLTFEAPLDTGGQSLTLSFEVVIDGDSFRRLRFRRQLRHLRRGRESQGPRVTIAPIQKKES